MDHWRNLADWQAETERRVARATGNFRAGYNCAQSVALAFADAYSVPEPLMARIASSFGAGIGRMRETCGAACAIFMLAGLEVADADDTVQPDPDPRTFNPYPDVGVKKKDYQVVQRLASDFQSATGSLLCRQLLLSARPQSLSGPAPVSYSPEPEPRTEEYYRKRPCIRMIETAVRIYMNYLMQKYT